MAERSQTVVIEAFGCTHTGRVRDANEDFLLLGDLDTGEVWTREEPFRCEVNGRGPLLVVCDGLGGALAGEVASKLAAEIIWSEMHKAQSTTNRAIFARLLRRAVRAANRRVWEQGKDDPKLRGMGTTVSAVGMVGDALIIAQVGDSRAYVLRGKTLVQVTRDQSVISALVHSGLSMQEARALPESNMILQALGIRPDIEVALSIAELRQGDRLLICSDGLHGPVPEEALVSLLRLRSDARAAAELLIDAACAAGGPDNVTAVVANLSGEGLKAPAADDDLPRFIELDPMEEGARALATTSVVARRLAARAGLVDDPGPPVVPATGQHTAIRGPLPRRLRPRTRPGSQPETRGQEPASGTGSGPAAEPASSAWPAWLIWSLIMVAALMGVALLVWLLR